MQMTFAFVSEKGAEEFVAWLEEEYDYETEILSFLHVEVETDEFYPEELQVADAIQAMADRCGAQDVLL